MREKTSAIAVELLSMQQARMTFARSPPGTGLIIDAALETGGAPIDELEGPHGTEISADILIPVLLHSTEIMVSVSMQ